MRYALIYGGLAGAIVITVISLGLILGTPNHATGSLWFGYLVMLASMTLLFVGVKRYRDVECGGVVRFGRAFIVGLGTAIVAGIIYAIGWEIVLAVTGVDFIGQYAGAELARLRAQGADAATIAAKTEEMRQLAVSYNNPLFRLPMTFVEIFPVGLLVALVSALLLRNPRFLAEQRRPDTTETVVTS